MKDTTAPPLTALTGRWARPAGTAIAVASCAILLNRVLTQSHAILLLTATVLVVLVAGAILALPLLDRLPARPTRATPVRRTEPATTLHLVPRR